MCGRSCCFCLSLRKGVLVIGTIALTIQVLVALIQLMFVDIGCLLYLRKSCSQIGSVEIVFIALWNIINFLATVSLIYGSEKNKRFFLLGPLIVLILSAFVFFVLMIMFTFGFFWAGRDEGFLFEFIAVATIPVAIYLFSVIVRRYLEIRSQEISESSRL